MSKVKVLLVEDTTYLGAELTAQLQALDFDVFYMNNGVSILSIVKSFHPDIVFLDVDLGETPDGISICRDLYAVYPTLPIILISSYTDPDIRIQGIKAGAKAFVGKPLTANLLEAYIELYVSKTKSQGLVNTDKDKQVQLASLQISFKRGLVFYPNGDAVSISPIPAIILQLLMSNMGKEVSTEHIMNTVWGKKSPVSSQASIYNAILSLRKILSPDTSIRLRTARGWGYSLSVEVYI